jgi:hypothetical protein
MIVLDLWEWVVNLFVLSMSLVTITMIMFILCLVVYTIQDWRGK